MIRAVFFVRTALLLGFLLPALGSQPAWAQVSLPAVFGDGMVLQRHARVPIFGTAAPGESVRVTVSWNDEERIDTTDDNGNWLVRMPTPGAGGPHSVFVSASNEIEFSDVLVGEVWLASGQSNMEMPLGNIRPGYSGVLDYEAEIRAAQYPEIRFFSVENQFAPSPRTEVKGQWRPCSPGSARFISASAYFFARELHRELDVPIGILSTDWGGTLCEAWMSIEALATTRDFADDLMVLFEELEDPKAREQRRARLRTAFWNDLASVDMGTLENWQSPELDDSEWQKTRVPGIFEKNDEFNGVIWFRKTFVVDEGDVNRQWVLELGPVDDMDTTFVNGKRVGGMQREGVWLKPRTYSIPPRVLRTGRNVVAVRVLDTGGASGLTGGNVAIRMHTQDDSLTIPLHGEWLSRISNDSKRLPQWPEFASVNHNFPTVLYNAMLAPIVPYGIRGAIWYQGESNRARAMQYRWLFPALIQDWRQHFGQGPFPFYFAQIAPFDYSGDVGEAAALREAQLFTLSSENTGMACLMDIGNPRDIHPKNKQEVGRRLALQALRKTYDFELVADGPLYRGMHIEGSSIRINFASATGLRCAGPVQHFEIAGADHVFHDAHAHIEGETVVVSSGEVAAPQAVRFAWGAADHVELKNGAGLPAAGFRTHEW